MKKYSVVFFSLVMLILLSACESEFEMKIETPIADSIEMDFTVGTDLIQDGSIETTLLSCTDGDTAEFDTGLAEESVRFLGVDTPETHHPNKGVEPWGHAAKQFTCEVLTNADEIVLQADEAAGYYGTYGRVLAYVWVDGTLLNAQLIELGLAQAGLNEQFIYYESLEQVFIDAYGSERGVYGQEDPNWDYESDNSGECSKSQCIIDRDYEYNFIFPNEE